MPALDRRFWMGGGAVNLKLEVGIGFGRIVASGKKIPHL
jgi:hypothetical protein